MKSLGTAVFIFLVFNALALVGGGVWLHKSDRWSKQRYDKMVEIFALTNQQQKMQEEQAMVLSEQAKKSSEHLLWLDKVKHGPKGVLQRLNEDQESRDLMMQILARSDEDRKALVQNMDQRQMQYQKLLDELRQLEEELKTRLGQRKQYLESQGFKQATALIEKSKAKQAKKILVKLLESGDQGKVIDYLAAMQSRNAVGILKEFKTDNEVAYAKDLIEGLRIREVDILLGRN